MGRLPSEGSAKQAKLPRVSLQREDDVSRRMQRAHSVSEGVALREPLLAKGAVGAGRYDDSSRHHSRRHSVEIGKRLLTETGEHSESLEDLYRVSFSRPGTVQYVGYLEVEDNRADVRDIQSTMEKLCDSSSPQ